MVPPSASPLPAPTSDTAALSRRRGAALWLTLVGGCTGGAPAPVASGEVTATPTTAASTPGVTPTTAAGTPGATPTTAASTPGATATKPDAEVRQIALTETKPPPVITPTTPTVIADSSEPPLLSLPLAVAAAGFERVDPGWTVALELDRAVALEPLDAGVLFRLAGAAHELGPDGTPVAVAVDKGRLGGAWEDQPLLGTWPEDAWYVRERTRDREGSLLTFMRWRANKRWVAQNSGADHDENEVVYHRSPRSGMLVSKIHPEEGSVSLERFAGKHPAPDPFPLKEGQRVMDLFESLDGTLFMFAYPQWEKEDVQLEILRSCAGGSPGCERVGGVALSVGREVRGVGPMAARQRDSISAVISLQPAFLSKARTLIVHHEAGGWKLEPTPDDPTITGLLPAPDGGLWIVTDHALWHRSAAGTWTSVTLPERRDPTERVQLALRDEGHVWLAVNTGDHHALYAAPAVLPTSAGASAPG